MQCSSGIYCRRWPGGAKPSFTSRTFSRIGNHSMRATALTEYMKNGGSLAKAREIANHADTRTTQLYDRSADVASLDEYGKVGI